jgi:hypothetical protein
MWSAIIFTLTYVALKTFACRWRYICTLETSDSNLCRDHRISWWIFGFPQSLHATAEAGDLATTNTFFKILIRHSTNTLSVYTVQCLVLKTVVKQSVSKHLFWPNSNSGSLVPWLMNVHCFRKCILIADVTTGSQSVWIGMRYQGTLHIHLLTLLISYKHIQRIPAFVKKKSITHSWTGGKDKMSLDFLLKMPVLHFNIMIILFE